MDVGRRTGTKFNKTIKHLKIHWDPKLEFRKAISHRTKTAKKVANTLLNLSDQK